MNIAWLIVCICIPCCWATHIIDKKIYVVSQKVNTWSSAAKTCKKIGGTILNDDCQEVNTWLMGQGTWIQIHCNSSKLKSGQSTSNSCYQFSDATTHLYKRLCPSVRPSVCPLFFSNDDYGRFWGDKVNDIRSNDKISENEEVASDVPPRYLSFCASDLHLL